VGAKNAIEDGPVSCWMSLLPLSKQKIPSSVPIRISAIIALLNTGFKPLEFGLFVSKYYAIFYVNKSLAKVVILDF
jgi:hypothetical protein